jgi:hypothetical protein
MANPSTLEWDAQTGGSDNNGGAFDTASSGVDGSQSTTPIASYTDIVIGATTTQGTSVARPFVSTDQGNQLNIMSGTGFTVQRVNIVSVSAGVATFDKSLGTAASTGGTGNLGGCLATIRPCFLAASPAVAGNKIHVKAGTYTNTTTITLSAIVATQNLPIQIIGYQTTHNDGGTKPLITTATNTTPLFTMTNAPYIEWRNVLLTNTATTRAAGILGLTTASAGAWSLIDSIMDGFSNGIDSATNSRGAASLFIIRSTIKNSTVSAVNDSTAGLKLFIDSSVFYNNTTTCFRMTAINGANDWTFVNNIFAKSGAGINDLATTRPTTWTFKNNTFVDITGVCVNSAETTSSCTLIDEGNIIYNCGTGFNFAFSGGVDRSTLLNDYNAYGANTTNRTGLSAGAHDITLTADPFVNRAAANYALNNTAGGGALLRAANFPGALNVGGTGYLDVGALQHQDTGGGTTVSGFLYM